MPGIQDCGRGSSEMRFARGANAHLSDDETVAKMGPPTSPKYNAPMKSTVQELVLFSMRPSDPDHFGRWVSLSDVESFLRQSVVRDEIVIQALSGHTFFHTVIVPHERLQLFSAADRLNWEIQTDACWGVEIQFSSPPSMRVADPLENAGSPFYAKAEQIVFSRMFEGRIGDKHYYELLQKLAQLAEIHFVEERNAWCRLDKNGDIEDVVTVIKIPGKGDDFDSDFVTIKRKVLDDYLVLTNSVAARVFDITRLDSSFSMWRDGQDSENLASPDIVYRTHVEAGRASYMRGSQIISPLSSPEDVFDRVNPFSEKGKKYESFLVHDWRHQRLTMVSCAPGSTANYFVKSDLPFEISPAFFRSEVLAKYKGDSDKYRVDDRSITCRGVWRLKGIDINDAGQIHAYIVDLRNLP
jgi:hypothetical protein